MNRRMTRLDQDPKGPSSEPPELIRQIAETVRPSVAFALCVGLVSDTDDNDTILFRFVGSPIAAHQMIAETILAGRLPDPLPVSLASTIIEHLDLADRAFAATVLICHLLDDNGISGRNVWVGTGPVLLRAALLRQWTRIFSAQQKADDQD